MLRDYAKRVWDNAGEDNVLFLAGGIAFNILLAAVPFVLLLVWGFAAVLHKQPGEANRLVVNYLDRVLPSHVESPDAPTHRIISDILANHTQLGVWSAVGYVSFSTRLFGSLRTVLASVFDIEQERGIVAGKLFDIQVTVVSTVLVVAYSTLSAYLAIGTSQGVALLQKIGVRGDVIGGAEYWFGRVVAFAVIVAMFFGLYKFLPIRRVRWQTALLASMFTSMMLELAKAAFAYYIARFIGKLVFFIGLAVVVIVVFWVYYAALIFILGGEVGQVFELRRTRKRQREVFQD